MKNADERKLRPFQNSDSKTVLSWAEDETVYYRWCAGVIGPWPPSTQDLHFSGNSDAYVYEEGDTPIGMFTVRWSDDSPVVMRLGYVIVDPARRNQGIGRAMIEKALELAFDHYRAKKAELAVFEDNLPAIACYTSAGFQPLEGRSESYSINKKKWNCIVMQKGREEQL